MLQTYFGGDLRSLVPTKTSFGEVNYFPAVSMKTLCSSEMFVRIPQTTRHITDVSKGGDTLSSLQVSSCDVNACSWDVRGDLTL